MPGIVCSNAVLIAQAVNRGEAAFRQCSFLRVGLAKPVVIDEKDEVIMGNVVLAAAKELGVPEVPTTTRSGLSDAEKRALAIADNRLAELSEWDQPIRCFRLQDAPQALETGLNVNLPPWRRIWAF